MSRKPDKDELIGRVAIPVESKIEAIEVPAADDAIDEIVVSEAVVPAPQPYQPNKADWLPKRESSLRRLHRWLKIIEPWGIALALIAFAIDYNERVEERTRGAWELLALSGPGNSGKIDALDYLNSQGLFKRRQSLTRIDLASEQGKARTYLRGASLPGANLTEANLSGAVLAEADLSGADLGGADLSGADLFRADLSRAFLTGTALSRAFLVVADLSEADLFRADLSGVEFEGADLSGAVLSRADLSGAKFEGADLSGAVLFRADLSGAVLQRAKNLTQEQLDEACGDDRTLLPEGLTIPVCSDVDWYAEREEQQSAK